MKKLLLILNIFLFSNTFSQVNLEFLPNEWILIKKEMQDGSSYFMANSKLDEHNVIIFNKYNFRNEDFSGNELGKLLKINFKIKDSRIVISNDKYLQIEKLTENEFIYTQIFASNLGKNIRYYHVNYRKLLKEELEKNNKKDTLKTNFILTPYLKDKEFIRNLFNNEKKDFKIKGNLIIDIKNKKIKTTLTDKENLTNEDFNKIYKIFNDNFSLWNVDNVKNFSIVIVPFVIETNYIEDDKNSFSRSIIEINTDKYFENKISTEKLLESQDFFNRAVNYYQNKNLLQSLLLFEKSFESNMYNIDAHYNYASIAWELGKKDSACERWLFLKDNGQKEAEAEYNKKCVNN